MSTQSFNHAGNPNKPSRLSAALEYWPFYTIPSVIAIGALVNNVHTPDALPEQPIQHVSADQEDAAPDMTDVPGPMPGPTTPEEGQPQPAAPQP